MIYNYPFGGIPPFRKFYYQNANYYNTNNSKYNKNNVAPSSNSFENSTSNLNNNNFNHFNKNDNQNCYCNTQKEPTLSSSIQNENKKVDFSCNDNFYNDTEYFNLFGLSLHIDDLLILALLFFLYQEGIDDLYLYIALILLLLN